MQPLSFIEDILKLCIIMDDKKQFMQVDLMLLDFCKAFNKVPNIAIYVAMYTRRCNYFVSLKIMELRVTLLNG